MSYPTAGAHGRAVHGLGTRIVAGHVSPDAPLDLDQLAAEFGLARPALREALRVLAAKGLVSARQKRGTMATPRSEWNLLDDDVVSWIVSAGGASQYLDELTEVRWVVEPAIASMAARRRTVDDLVLLQQALDDMSSTRATTRQRIVADLAFHRLLAASTGNEVMLRVSRLLQGGLAARDDLVHEVVGWERAVEVHQGVLEAVRDGDSSSAQSRMTDLLQLSASDLRAVGCHSGNGLPDAEGSG